MYTSGIEIVGDDIGQGVYEADPNNIFISKRELPPLNIHQ